VVDGVREWRPRRGERYAGCGFIGFGLVVMALGIRVSTHGGSILTWAQTIVESGAFIIAGTAFAVRMRIALTKDVVIVTTALRTRWFPVTSIASVRTGTRGIIFTLEDGRQIRSCLVVLRTTDQSPQRASRPGTQRRLKLAHEIEHAVRAATLRE
jgi:hypothetical protein